MTNPSPFTLAAAPLLALALAAPPAAHAQAKVVPEKSQITFAIKEMGVSVEGKFAKWTSDIAFDPKNPAAGKVAFTIDTASATLGSPETDSEVPKPTWFNVAKFPAATFTSTAIAPKGAGHYDVAGKLTIKGAAHDVTVPIAVAQSGGVTTADGQFTIKRLDYKIGEGEWTDTSTLANEVLVKFHIALTGVAAL
jgi:polyisoprenoid-binding protein YceI